MKPPEPGEVLAGKYRVERILGQGGMGVVVQAMHLELEERVAVKFLLPEFASQPEAAARFLREAKAAVKIKSEHVARVIDVGKLETGAPYMVMEFLSGRDLSEVLESRGTLSVEDTADYLLQACEALAEAHAAGIVHRDLKPANLFLTKRADGSAVVKVLDFGISKVTVASDSGADHSLTKTSALMGSPLYMSPEQMRSARNVDARSDLWSLGAILFELTAGRPPFVAESLPELLAMILTDPAPSLRNLRPDAPEGFAALVARCLEKNPTARFPTVADLAIALGPFAPKRSRVSVERISKVMEAAGLSKSGIDYDAMASRPPAAAAGTVASFGKTGSAAGGGRSVAIAGAAAAFLLLAGGGYFMLRSTHTAASAEPIATQSLPMGSLPAAPAAALPPAPAAAAAPPAPSASGQAALPNPVIERAAIAPAVVASAAAPETRAAAVRPARAVTRPHAAVVAPAPAAKPPPAAPTPAAAAPKPRAMVFGDRK